MAKEKKRISTELAKLIPDSIEIKDGEDIIRVAGNAEENRILNYLLAAQIRSLIERNVKKFAELESPLTPRELKEIADAGRSLAEFSAEIYKSAEPVHPERPVESAATEILDFSKLKPMEAKP